IIIMTSNMGSQLIRENFEKMTDANKGEVIEKTKNQVLDMLKSNIRPEFLNRIDEIIMFTPLNKKEIQQIVALQINAVKRTLEKNGIELNITDKAVDLLADEGYDPEFGARPVKRVIQREILNRLSKDILAGNVDKDRSITIDASGEEFIFRN
ncbi:MAG: AAA family ATPase, partial [Bacteroidetes bacterium]|nr:AAA family ATPase [Candidatus Limisoma faecipullorum]